MSGLHEYPARRPRNAREVSAGTACGNHAKHVPEERRKDMYIGGGILTLIVIILLLIWLF